MCRMRFQHEKILINKNEKKNGLKMFHAPKNAYFCRLENVFGYVFELKHRTLQQFNDIIL